MHRCQMPVVGASVALLLATLSSCAPPVRHQNAAHPSYGDAEYKTDLAQCQKDNSTIVTTTGYDIRTDVRVDEAKAAACMTTRGWQASTK
jgi:hypothetical protein